LEGELLMPGLLEPPEGAALAAEGLRVVVEGARDLQLFFDCVVPFLGFRQAVTSTNRNQSRVSESIEDISITFAPTSLSA
jgi:hypothetical protein